jgi:hypothetical protein
VALAAGLAIVAVGCGRDDFENDPRPALPAEISVEIGDKGVVVSPSEFGAGLVNFTVANLADAPASVAIEGPTAAETEEIAPGGTTTLKVEVETGDYEASVPGEDAEPFEFEVGPERESAQDDLLLP